MLVPAVVFVTVRLYSVMIPFGIVGGFQLKVTLTMVTVDVKFCGGSSGPVKQNK